MSAVLPAEEGLLVIGLAGAPSSSWDLDTVSVLNHGAAREMEKVLTHRS